MKNLLYSVALAMTASCVMGPDVEDQGFVGKPEDMAQYANTTQFDVLTIRCGTCTELSFPKLKTVGALSIERNPALQTLDGLGELSRVDGSISMSENPSLTSLEGLYGIRQVHGVYIDLDTHASLPPCAVIAFRDVVKFGISIPPNCDCPGEWQENRCP